MIDATRYLTSLAQALAKMSLYADGHPARASAATASFAQLCELRRTDGNPRFSFLGRSVVYGERPLRELADWDWAARLCAAGVQRIEFPEAVSPEEYRIFLEEILAGIALASAGKLKPSATTTRGRATPIRFGAIALRGEDAPLDDAESVLDIDLTEEAEVVQWMHDEVLAERGLPIAEAEAVVQTLWSGMHRDANAFVPLLMLKEFDQYTTTHSLNVAVLSMSLAESLGLSSREARAYGIAGLLHDLGKVKIPKDILLKPGALTAEERQLMQAHPVSGARMILDSDSTLDLSATVAFEHHIMIDGGGYPTRCTRRDCHHASMLVHVCDVFDALRTHRPYRVAWETNAILDYIADRAGTEFHGEIARVFALMMREKELRHARAASIDEVRDALEHVA